MDGKLGVVGVLDQLGVANCVLVCESSGGAIAQFAVHQHSDRFSGLVLVDSASGERAKRGSNAFATACREDHSATVRAFVDRCVPELECDHVRGWARNILLRAKPEQPARLVEMWRDDDVPTMTDHFCWEAYVGLSVS